RSHRRISGEISNQTRMLSPRKKAVYFESRAAPAAVPTASHHRPCPVSTSFARKKSTKALATSRGASGVTTTVPPATINVRLKNTADVAERVGLLNRISAERHTAHVAGPASNTETMRTPNSVSPAINVPSRMTTATIGG